MESSTLPGDAEVTNDRLTIGRLLLLVAGMAVGLAVFAPHIAIEDLGNAATLRVILQAFAIGLTLPAPLLCLPRAIGNRRLGIGGLFALASGLGAMILLPAGVMELMARQNNDNRDQAGTCLGVALSLSGLWYLLAAILSGHVGRRLWQAQAPWTDRYGFFLALFWSPLGVWWIVDIYRDILR